MSNKALCVEGYAVLEQVYRFLLEPLQMEVEFITNVNEALERLRTSGREYDLLIADLGVDLEGLELLTESARLGLTMPKVLVSGGKDVREMANTYEALYFRKPWDTDEFRAAVCPAVLEYQAAAQSKK